VRHGQDQSNGTRIPLMCAQVAACQGIVVLRDTVFFEQTERRTRVVAKLPRRRK
jgi:hypothetical protein